jgi:hypothetical protein
MPYLDARDRPGGACIVDENDLEAPRGASTSGISRVQWTDVVSFITNAQDNGQGRRGIDGVALNDLTHGSAPMSVDA